jgi:uncharacterized protein
LGVAIIKTYLFIIMQISSSSMPKAVQLAARLAVNAALILMLMMTIGPVAPAAAIGVAEMPATPPEGHVLDLSEILSRITEGQINTQLDKLAADSKQDVVFVSVRRLDYEETVDTFAQALFDRWYPTPDSRANKTLLVIDSLTDNTSIIQGETSQAAMAADIATSVAKETVLVPLKYGNRYNQAFLDASDRVSLVLAGQEDPGAPEFKEVINVEGNFATPEETKESNATTWMIVLLFLSTAIPMATYYFYQYMGSR